MQRFALPAATVVIASLVAPVAGAATMAETYEPYFAPETSRVYGQPGDFNTHPIYLELKGVPEGAEWKLTGEETIRNLFQLKKVGDKLQIQLNHNDKNPVERGENTQEITVRVNFPDTSTDLYQVPVTLIPDHAFLYEPRYDDVEADPGKSVTLTPTNVRHLDLPTDATWDVKGNYDSVDQKTGAITVTLPKDSYDNANLDVTTTFADGSKRSTQAVVTNTGRGVVEKQTPTPTPVPAGSTPLQKVALVFGILAVIAGIGFAAMPYLQQFGF
ncbi:hypothetical protein HMPREF2736_06420 [Corynebacterium sp. HMSC036E10]|uniref:YPDG domain-containing protein n=1 Tax=Corynebacterium sp. HMSC036E10 TaxID=1715215 RepID=UPI0008A8DEDD|nr:YPDG domain-containing protein [Corynebacterium sp. HMSC036E10]OHO81558.1 hypothetical protein HMPREF2736_06420 [Corynebacterium sp. HMSC036E10]